MAANNNTELVHEMMEFSKFGAIAQLFIMDALTKHTNRIAGMTVAELEAQWGGNPLFTAAQWHAVAVDLKRQMDKFYGRHEPVWREWTGGECPVDGEEVVTVRLEDGREQTELAKEFDWTHCMQDTYHIVKYRVSR